MVALRAVELDLAHRRPGVFETHLRERVVCAKARQRALIEFTAAIGDAARGAQCGNQPGGNIINATSTSTIVKPAFMTARGNGHRRCRQYARIFLLQSVTITGCAILSAPNITRSADMCGGAPGVSMNTRSTGAGQLRGA